MKNLITYLSKKSLSRTDRVRTLAIDAVSLPSFCRVNMLKLVSILAILLTVGVEQMWGAETLTTTCVGTGSGYGTRRTTTYDGIGWVLASGQSGYLGTGAAASHETTLPTNADLPVVKAQYASATTSTTGYYYYYTSTAISNVTKIEITYSAKKGSSTVNAYVVSSSTAASSGSATWSKPTLASGTGLSAQGTNIASATGTYTFKLNTKETSSKYYGIILYTGSYSRLTDGAIKIYTDAPSEYNVVLSRNGATETINNVATGTALDDIDGTGAQGGCSAWTFVGWSKTQRAAQNVSTAMTLVTEVDGAGPYYAVYRHTEGGGGFTLSLNKGGTEYYVGTKGSGSYLLAVTDAADAVTFEYSEGYLYYDDSGTAKYISSEANNTTLTIQTTPTTATWTEGGSGPYTYQSSATGNRYLALNDGASPKRFAPYGSTYAHEFTKHSAGTTYYSTTATCCTDPGLNYGTASVTKTYGASAFTNPLTNSHSVAVTYSSSDETVATVNGSGQVTILKAGSTTITASSIAQTVSTVDYCADEASYTLTVNKADISPTLTYDPAAVTVGSTLTSFTLSGNSGSGTVTYVSSNDAIATVNSSGVVTGVAPGTVTITATIAATTNYNGNTATSNTITVNAAACTGVNSLHTGNKDQGGWVTNQCFEDADWGAADDAIYVGAFPLTNECYVGWAGGNSYHGTYWAVGGIKTYDIPTGRTLGWNSGNYYESYPGGALGTFHIYKNSTDENYYLRFKPSSYILRTGSDGTSWTSREMTVSATNSHYYETAELDLTSTLISEHAYVDLKTNGGDGHVWCNFSNDRTASGNVKVKSSVGDADGNFRGDNLKASDNGTHGKFRIDVTKDVDNWKLAFVPMYRITYAPGTGASGSMDPSSYAEISTTIAAAAEGFTDPTGKQFNGWSDGVNSYAAGANVTMNSNVTLTAQWTDIDYTVTVSQSPDVSATTTGQTSSAHYNGTINLTVTDIPSGYRFVNWTTSDGFSITNSTSATTASFTMPAKNVTVTANFQQTHKVDWYVGGSAPANKIGDDGQTTVVDHGGKISAFPATTPDGSPCDKEFVGWTNTSSYVHGTSPLFNDVAGSPAINADANFYAVFAEVTGGTDYEQVTSLDDIHDGPAYFAYYGSYSGSRWYGVNSVSTITAPVTVSEGVLTTSTGDYTLTEFTIVTVDAANHIYYIKIGDDYVIGSSSGSNTDLSLDDAPYAWTFESINSTTYNMQISHTYTTPSTTCYMKAGVGTATGGKFRSYPTTGQQISLFQTTESVTGHTINCADCGSSVTPTYTAAPTGGTVSVTKNAAAVASGSTVKTCTSQDLTVILTPATHYDLTGFTATGLTTGTATITPAVGSTLPVSVAQTFTVTVSAGATGTLTLAPTFTAQTPLSITLETHSKGTFTPIGDVYSGESFTFPTVTPSDAECSSFLGWIEGTTWSGDGTETDPTAITGLANYHAAGSSSGTLTTTKTYTAVFGEKDTQVIPAYQKVTSAPSNWSGDYLIVRDANSRAFDGSLSTLDAADNYIGVTISEGSITANSTVNASKWTIAKVGATSNYTIKSASGYYIGRTASSNGLNSSTSEAYTNTLSYSDDHVVITSSGGPTLQMNSGTRFRYYTTSQQALQLYKYNPDAEVVSYTYTTNPACTPRYRVTISSATGGSPEADKTYEHADETITITANPAAGYSFTSWTITKTTGGDNVTSTLLTGDKPTTANTTFTMPAYDITIAATYTKKMVSTLEVKDGATVVSTTTGPVSGTVNISTGANKTLDVVITPSDAFDHSWTATVTAGGTYASISNVTSDGFRVNGLSQGDATVTVTAPNDGSAKVVTFTVHVTDVLPEEIILKRDGSVAEIETLTMYYDAANSRGQYVKVNVSYSPTPTNKNFAFSSAATGKVGSHSHSNVNLYEVLVANGVTSSPVNCTFTSEADGSVTKVLAVTVLPLLTDRFVDYIQGNATQTVSARLSADRYDIITDINTPSISDASDANPTSEDCKTAHYHMIGWLPQATAEALWAAGTAITEDTEGLVSAGATVEATGQTWYAIWAKEE